jgi:uncharacterized protein (TIGR00255 family)
MILSMTGYGEAFHDDGGVSYSLEIRSLNNRYLKLAIKLPDHLQFLETEVERLIRERLGRGSITYAVRVRDTSAKAAYEINPAAIRSYLDQLRSVGDGPGLSIDLAALLDLPGVCQPREADESGKEHWWKILQTLTEQAIERLLTMRQNEGRALRDDLLKHLDKVRGHIEAVRARSPEVVKLYQARLRQRVDALLAGAQLALDKDLLAREVAIYADRCDINEELSRLSSHIDQFTELCDSKELAGRKLDFLTQEMLREANTIGSKAGDSEISRQIVEIKALIDRLKEQVQNVE